MGSGHMVIIIAHTNSLHSHLLLNEILFILATIANHEIGMDMRYVIIIHHPVVYNKPFQVLISILTEAVLSS